MKRSYPVNDTVLHQHKQTRPYTARPQSISHVFVSLICFFSLGGKTNKPSPNGKLSSDNHLQQGRWLPKTYTHPCRGFTSGQHSSKAQPSPALCPWNIKQWELNISSSIRHQTEAISRSFRSVTALWFPLDTSYYSHWVTEFTRQKGFRSLDIRS